MIERSAFLKLAPAHAAPAQRRALAARALEVLAGLPGVEALTVGLAADDDTAAAWDVCVTVRCATPEALAAYRAHPVHRRFVEDEVAPRCVARKAWNFELVTR